MRSSVTTLCFLTQEELALAPNKGPQLPPLNSMCPVNDLGCPLSNIPVGPPPNLPGCNSAKAWAKGDAIIAGFFSKVVKVNPISETFGVATALEGAYALLGGCATK